MKVASLIMLAVFLNGCSNNQEDVDTSYMKNSEKDTLLFSLYDTEKVVTPIIPPTDTSNYDPRVSDTTTVIKRVNIPIRIKFTNEGGVLKIPVSVNGQEMFFIFDTGASDVLISSLEATFLIKEGKLSKDDVIGEREYMDASGNVNAGTLINLKEIKIGEAKLQNVVASVVDNPKAPLLLGQSALKRFFKVSVDYAAQEVVFE